MLLHPLLFLLLLLIVYQVFINCAFKKGNHFCATLECCLYLIYLFYIFFTGDDANHKYHVPFALIIGGLGVGLVLIILSIVLCVCLRSSNCYSDSRSHEKDGEGKVSHKFHILRNPSFLCGSGRYICGKHVDHKQRDGDSSTQTITVPKASSK
jgi:hypothetical protein